MVGPDVTGAIKPRSSKWCTTRPFLQPSKLSWLKGLTFLIDLNTFANFYHIRTFAITRKNKWIAGILYTISAAQFSIGVFLFVWSAMNPGRYYHPTTCISSSSRTKDTFQAADIPNVPLDSFHLCVTKSIRPITTLQMALSFIFGRHFATPSNLPVSRIEPPVLSLRPRGFCVRPRTNTDHRTEVPRDEYAEYYRYSH